MPLERLLCASAAARRRRGGRRSLFYQQHQYGALRRLYPCPVAVDAEGMDPDGLEEALRNGARAVILTPRAHNPTGCSLTENRAHALREVLARYPQVLAIVDDHFALLSATPWHSPLPASTQRWALVRSMSQPRARPAAGLYRQRCRYLSGAAPAAQRRQPVGQPSVAGPDAGLSDR